MMNIGIDIDGTIKQTQRAAIQLFNEELNRNITEDEVTTFYLDEPYGLTGEEGAKVWRKLEERIYTIGIPLEHAPKVLTQLKEEGHNIYFITARPENEKIEKVTIQWLKKHGFPYDGHNLFMNSQQKGNKAKELEIDLFFEDDPTHIDNLLTAGIHTVIVDTHYNREYDKSIPRIKDWLEGLELIKQFKQSVKNNK